MMKKLSLALALAAGLAGCASVPPPTPQQMAAADYGDLPEKAYSYVKGYLGARLKDPYSAKYTFTYEKGYIDLPDNRRAFGYFVYPTINAKNSFGGYTGNKMYRPVFVRVEDIHMLICIDNRCDNL
jgi:hypothetical protein